MRRLSPPSSMRSVPRSPRYRGRQGLLRRQSDEEVFLPSGPSWMIGRVLVVAGSDSGAGAGIQADIKTVAALGGYAATAITALTAQNTLGVHAVMAVPGDFVRRQMEAVLDDIGADCLKTGMLHDAAVIGAVIDVLERKACGIPLVIDPVMVSTLGTRLLDAAAVELLKGRLIPRSTVLTPNVPEAAVLTGLEISDLDGMKRAAEWLI